jgi:hypothetical protein
MPGPCSAPNGDARLVYVSEMDRVKALEKKKLCGEMFVERRAQQGTGKTRVKRKKGALDE